MDKELEAYAARARLWLAENAHALDPDWHKAPEADRVAAAKAWQRRKWDAGYACISWPREYGGQGGERAAQAVFAREEARYDAPRGILDIGLGMCVPALLAHGSHQQKLRYAPSAARGEEIWCQLFSEPGAGSDLAALRTQAVRDGEGWRIRGQKVWTSGAHYAQFGLLLARTDPAAPKHRGLSAFVLDMAAKGVSVRPIRQITGEADFCEVFFDDVRLEGADQIGAAGEGWSVALTTLMHERATVGPELRMLRTDHMIDLAIAVEQQGAGAPLKDPAFRRQLAEWHVNERGLKLLQESAFEMALSGQAPGPERAVSKLVAAAQGQAMAAASLDMLGPASLSLEAAGDLKSLVERSWLWGAAMRIAGGTDEILRNIIGERVLGLPTEPRMDKAAPQAPDAR